METLRKEYLIAHTEDFDRIITGEIKVTYRNNYPEFTASFSEGQLINVDDQADAAEDYYNDLFEYGYDAEGKLDLLDGGERTKADVIKSWIADEYDYHDRIDCSCTDYEFTLNGTTYNYETTGAGQYDPRDNFDTSDFVNVAAFRLCEYWDAHHMEEITEDDYEALQRIMKRLDAFDLDNLDLSEYIKNELEKQNEEDR